MITRPIAKLAVPAAGLLAFYAGGLLGVLLASGGGQAPGPVLQFLATGALSLALAFGALFASIKLIGPAASHADPLKTLLYMAGAALALFAFDWALARTVGGALPVFVENLALWAAGVAAVWENEPGFANWRTALGSLRDPRSS